MTDLEDLKGKTFSWNDVNRNDNSNEAEWSDRQVDDATAKRHNAVTILQISPELKAAGIKQISFSEKYLYIDDCNGNSTQSDLDKGSISKTLAYFDNLVDGTFDDSLKKAIKIFIAEVWDSIGAKTKNNTTKNVSDGNDRNDRNDNNQGQEKSTKAELVIPLIKPLINQLFTDEYEVAHAAIKIDDHVKTPNSVITDSHLEILRLDSRHFKNWMARQMYLKDGMIIDGSTLRDIMAVLSAQAAFESPTVPLALRVANVDGTWYYDLTNKKWEFVEITPEGWRIVKNCVVFRRYNPAAQAEPSTDYSLDIFDKFIDLLNIQGYENRLLLKCYIVSLFIPDIPKVALILSGEQGSAKTTLEELIKMLVDPGKVRTFSFPRDITEFIQQLAHNYVCPYDNISLIRGWISDLLCRAITGSGFSKRELYTTDSDFIYNIMRCILLNGITVAATKADLLDRSLMIHLEQIKDTDRRKKEDVERQFEKIKPQLLGYIFDILVKVLAWKKEHGSPNIKLSRMADWTEYSEIIARCMGYKENQFLNAYKKNTDLQSDEVINASPVATALIRYMELSTKKDVELTATKWLSLLEETAYDMGIDTRYKSWPKAANYFSQRLKELENTLRGIGIDISWSVDSKTKARIIRIVSNLSYPSYANQNQAQNSEHEKEIGDDRNDTLHTFEGNEIDSDDSDDEDLSNYDEESDIQ